MKKGEFDISSGTLPLLFFEEHLLLKMLNLVLLLQAVKDLYFCVLNHILSKQW